MLSWQVEKFLANSSQISVDVSFFSDEEVVELPDLDYLRTMTHIVFVDFDNWSDFFGHLPGHLNQGTFIWGFQGMAIRKTFEATSPTPYTHLRICFALKELFLNLPE